MAKLGDQDNPYPFSAKELAITQLAVASMIECLYEESVNDKEMPMFDRVMNVDAMDTLLSVGHKIEKMSGLELEFEDIEKQQIIDYIKKFASQN